MTYAEHQEAVAAALLRLLEVPTPPVGEREQSVLLGCRRQAHLAILERLDQLGVHRHLRRPPRSNRTIDAAHHPLHVLLRVVSAMPSTSATTLSPSSLLTGPPVAISTSTIDLWRAVARHLTLGNADLFGSADQSWRGRAPTWHLVGDLATTVEALVLLDEQLASATLLERLTPDAYLDHRLASG